MNQSLYERIFLESFNEFYSYRIQILFAICENRKFYKKNYTIFFQKCYKKFLNVNLQACMKSKI